ncbi:hypothetical protein CISG_02076 [Coccidioides immitis RMSCC 3703]|uniref:Uncharacterized protein n=2 Tax=Coccidioides immitis TaxID=5501 RepID=A0A0J8R7E2_COCIT|nr:hypothetical protein CIRG_07735 [Coccidioides immitis RMSCC 2394]KMU79658.1 hypothetical protein CISG_02076 [Coccidioides immitis RMSCC 3703]
MTDLRPRPWTTSYQWSWFRARRDRLAHHMERSTSRFCKLLVDPPNILTRPAPKFQKMTFSIKVDINIFNRVLPDEPTAVVSAVVSPAFWMLMSITAPLVGGDISIEPTAGAGGRECSGTRLIKDVGGALNYPRKPYKRALNIGQYPAIPQEVDDAPRLDRYTPG